MDNFTPIASLVGGLIIGLSSTLLLLMNGRIAGISGITGNIVSPRAGDIAWRLAFVGGLVSAGAALFLVWPEYFAVTIDRSVYAVAAAGLLVGIGTRAGSGCTSGHGVCGTSRLSPRSIIATLTFMATGAATVFIVDRFFGGAL
ncbi:MAG: YeeE/YedE family protein [Deltaproteobacteria bacterium]|nr:YeeE/YedE family protein [Deltaproteobacteria bacterium]